MYFSIFCLFNRLFLILILWTCVLAHNNITTIKDNSIYKYLNQLKIEPLNKSIDSEIFIKNNFNGVLEDSFLFDPLNYMNYQIASEDSYKTSNLFSKRSLKNSSVIYFWGKWSKWGKCSRSCGGGVQTRVRHCLSSNSTVILKYSKHFVNGCEGLIKRYRLCNDKECQANNRGQIESFRNKQCRSYDNVLFAGQYYEWQEYLSGDNECELNCIKRGTNVYAKLNDAVIDGTPCIKSSVYFSHHYRGRSVCVEGICKAVHASGAIRGATTDDSPYRCGSVLCRPIVGSYIKPNIPSGYFFIATLPVGAWNISISQPNSSKNRLVLRGPNKRFIIDGEQEVSPNTTYLFTYQNNFFEYRRDNGSLETITTRGFLSRAVDLMILVKDINPGIQYSYFVPTPTNTVQEEDDEIDNGPQDYPDDNKSDASEESQSNNKNKKLKFTWKLIGFGPCTKSCGGGYQPPIFRCVRDIATRFYTPRRCMHLEKPVFHELVYRCNTQTCPGYWHVEDWGDCFCHNGKGVRERQIKCVQEQSSSEVIVQVEDSACTDAKPDSREGCGCPRQQRKKVHSQRSERSKIQSHLLGTHSIVSTNETIVKNDGVAGDDSSTRITRENAVYTEEKSEKSGSWLMSEWSNHCSVDCGIGVEHRSIFCDRAAPNTEPCDLRTTPDTTRFCESERNCDTGVWFIGRWSDCAGDCFNLTKKRDVFCIRDNVIVEDLECIKFKKPDIIRNCSFDEVHYCRPKWYYSEWTPCSRSCGGGIQRRVARCLEPDLQENTLKESKDCRYSERHSIFSTCNNDKCPDIVRNQRVEVIRNEIENEPCVDTFANCHVIDKGRVCKLNYYLRNCCATCSKR